MLEMPRYSLPSWGKGVTDRKASRVAFSGVASSSSDLWLMKQRQYLLEIPPSPRPRSFQSRHSKLLNRGYGVSGRRFPLFCRANLTRTSTSYNKLLVCKGSLLLGIPTLYKLTYALVSSYCLRRLATAIFLSERGSATCVARSTVVFGIFNTVIVLPTNFEIHV